MYSWYTDNTVTVLTIAVLVIELESIHPLRPLLIFTILVVGAEQWRRDGGISER